MSQPGAPFKPGFGLSGAVHKHNLASRPLGFKTLSAIPADSLHYFLLLSPPSTTCAYNSEANVRASAGARAP